MSKRNKLSTYFSSLDFFHTNIEFRENGGHALGSVFGACISIIISMVVVLYGINKFFVMINYDDTQYSEFTVKNGLSLDTFA